MSLRVYKKKLPTVVVSGMCVIPGMIIHFDINKPMAVKAIEKAMVTKDQQLFISMQREDADLCILCCGVLP